MDLQNSQPAIATQLSLTSLSHAVRKPKVWLGMSLVFHSLCLVFLWTFVKAKFKDQLLKFNGGEFAAFCVIRSFIGTMLLYLLYTLIARSLKRLGRAGSRFSHFAVKLVSMLIHQLMVSGAAESLKLQVIFCMQMCSFICFLRFYSGNDRAGIISALTLAFGMHSFRFLLQDAYVSCIVFAITALVVFMALTVEKLRVVHNMQANLSHVIIDVETGPPGEQEG